MKKKYGGFERLKIGEIHFTLVDESGPHLSHYLSLYIPNRCGFVLKKDRLKRLLVNWKNLLDTYVKKKIITKSLQRMPP